MTITKKVGALLLFLTVGSLVGILTFTVFLQRTSVDFLFFLGANNEERLLQQLYLNNTMIREGHSDIRKAQQELIQNFDALLNSLENGGPNASRVAPAEVVQQIQAAAAQPGTTLETNGPQVVRALTNAMPTPPGELKATITALRAQWFPLKDSFSAVADRPTDDAASVAASEDIQQRLPNVGEASRQVAAAAGARLIDVRRMMLATLASIAGLSILLFVAGLLLTRRFIARPVQTLRTASQKIGSGDFSYRVPDRLYESNDELADLGKTFNKMADQVQRSLERYQELFENATDFVYTTDLSGRFLTVNRAAETISGFTREELLKKTFAELTGSPLEPSMAVHEIHILSKDRKQESLENSTRLIYEDGKAVGIQGVARDVTERNRLKERLDLSQKMEAIGRLAGGISHDFGNVLTIIGGYCMLMRESLKPDDPLRAEVEGIQRASQRAVSMIRHLLSFSRGQILNPQLLSIEKALGELTDVFGRLIGENIQLTTKVDPDIGSVHIDPTQFEQVLVNLIMNARDAMPNGGKLRIEAASEVSNVRLTVTDTGSGMTPDVLSRIFEPFFSTKSSGTGLGLSSVYSIVKQSGGQISADSRPGAGTTMTIHLPRVPEVPPAERSTDETGATRGNETILLVEDEVDVRRFVRTMLRSEGYSVVEAQDQSEAIALFARPDERVDLVLTDVVMPNMSGPELADRLRVLRPDVKVLFMSGYPRDEFEQKLKRGETVHFIQKPLSSKMLAEKVRVVLDGEA